MIQQNSDYDVMSYAEVANIVSHFTPEMIEDAINQAIANSKVFEFGRMKPNIVMGINSMYSQYQIEELSQDIILARESTYNTIIELLCKNFGLGVSPNVTQATDRFSLAQVLYDFLIYKFDNYLVEFLSSYIIRESSTYAQLLNGIEGKNDNSSYTKKMFKGEYADLGIIHANLLWVLDQVCTADIEFADVVYTALGPANRVQADLLCTNIVDMGDFFKNICIPLIRQNLPFIVTAIKFNMQQRMGHSIAEFI